jgi:TolB protein
MMIDPNTPPDLDNAPENGRFSPSPYPPEPEPPRRKKRGCWAAGFSLLIILGLLGSAFASLTWAGKQIGQQWTLPWSPPPAPSLAEAGRITYIGQKGQVWSVQPDGANGRQLTNDNFAYQFPAWSPTGDQIAAMGGGELIVIDDKAGSAPETVYQGGVQSPFYLYWSPDSRQIGFLASHRSSIALRTVPADGSAEAIVAATGSPFYWDWLLDGEQMLIHNGTSGESARLGLLQADGSFENIAPPGAFQSPGVSANGRFWAYSEDIGNGNSALVVTDTESGEQWLERHPAVTAMGWSPAADQLAFITGIRDRDSFWGPLRLFDTKTGDVRLLSTKTVLAFFWSPDGRSLAVIHTGDVEPDFGVNVAAVPQTNRRTVAKTAVRHNPHQFTLSIFNVETGEETELLTFGPTRIFVAQFLPFFDQYALSHPLWSPNSDALVLPVREEGENRLKIIRVDGSEIIDIGSGDMAVWSR